VDAGEEEERGSAEPAVAPAVTRLTLELASEQVARWRQAAAELGLDLSAWMVRVCDEAAA
jgi:hypothetical protein